MDESLLKTEHVRATDEVNRLAKVLMDEWERVEGERVNVSRVATFADMARAVLATIEPDPFPPSQRRSLGERVTVGYKGRETGTVVRFDTVFRARERVWVLIDGEELARPINPDSLASIRGDES